MREHGLKHNVPQLRNDKLVTEMHDKSYSAPEPQRRSRWKKLALFFSFTNLCVLFHV